MEIVERSQQRLTELATSLTETTLPGVESVLSEITDCFRILRNACAGSTANQNAISDDCLRVTETVLSVLREYCTKPNPESSQSRNELLVCLRCGVQFLGNAVAGNSDNQPRVVKACATTLRKLTSLDDVNLCSYVTMVLYNCLPVWLQSDPVRATEVIELFATNPSDWSTLAVEQILCSDTPVDFRNLNPHARVAILEYIHECLRGGEPDLNPTAADVSNTENAGIHSKHIAAVCEQFKEDAHCILGLSQIEVGDLDSLAVSHMLSVLCAASSHRCVYTAVCSDQALLKCAVNMLHVMQLLGQSGDNAFSPVTKLAAMEPSHVVTATSGETDQPLSDHVVYGLKSSLIRLIANMAHDNPANQDLVGEMGGIQLIMNHTNIDGRNPFITQWSILAMRNLLRNHPGNQAIVAELQLQGVANNLSALREFGVEAELQGGQIVIKKITDPALNEPSPFEKRPK